MVKFLKKALCTSAKPFKFFVSSMTRVCILEACAHRKFHANKSSGDVEGGAGYFNALL